MSKRVCGACWSGYLFLQIPEETCFEPNNSNLIAIAADGLIYQFSTSVSHISLFSILFSVWYDIKVYTGTYNPDVTIFLFSASYQTLPIFCSVAFTVEFHSYLSYVKIKWRYYLLECCVTTPIISPFLFRIMRQGLRWNLVLLNIVA